MDERFLSPTEFAKLAGLHEQTVRRLCRDGELRGAIRLGFQWRIPTSALLSPRRPAGRPRKVAA